MNSLFSQLWAPGIALMLGLTAGWFARRFYALTEMRRMLDRMLLLDNELRSARAALIRERQQRLSARAALRQAELDRDSWAAQAKGEVDPTLTADLEDLMIEVVEDAPEVMGENMAETNVPAPVEAEVVPLVTVPMADVPTAGPLDAADMPESVSLARFRGFTPSAYSEPPPRESDVRELRHERSSEEITRRAYELWDAAGRPSGQDKHFWYLAEEELRSDEWRTAVGG